MSYVDSQLLPGESVAYRTHLHWIIFVMPVALALLIAAIGLSVVAGADGGPGGLLLLLTAAAVPVAWAYITHRTSEFAVTNKRVIIKVGWIRRRTLETLLSKVEGIGVDQGILGRLLGYGTITITGTGGTKEPFPTITEPLEFRRRVQAQVEMTEESRQRVRAPEGAPGIPRTTSSRDERECPFCAELILKKARVCKHCQREVAPVAAT